MKHLYLSLVLLIATYGLSAQGGDTVVIQTFSFSDPSPIGWSAPYRGTFEFPDASETYEKILMYYTLKCDPSTAHDGYNCGEWDYLTYTYVVDSAGVMDSTFRSNPNFRLIDGSTRDSVSYTLLPNWNYFQQWQPYVVYLDTLSLVTAQVGSQSLPSQVPFRTDALSGRAQFLWKKQELLAAGLGDAPLSGMSLDLSALGSDVRKLRIRMTNTLADSLSTFDNGSLDEVYYLNTALPATGWQRFAFLQPFAWDTSQHIVVELSFENDQPGTPSAVRATNTPATSGVYTYGRDHYLSFDGNDAVNLGQGPQITGNAPRTIEAWALAETFNDGGLFQAGPTGATGQDFSFRTMTVNNVWRFQMWGAPDFDVTLPGSRGAWHHYAVTLDGNVARVFYDGVQVGQKIVNVSTGVSDFWLGRWAGSYFRGQIDEVRVWSKALDAATLLAWKDRSVDASHPDYTDLVAYYKLDEGQGLICADAVGNQTPGQLIGPPVWKRVPATMLRQDVQQTTLRPNVRFEQGIFTSAVDSLLSVDSVQHTPLQLVIFDNPSAPRIIPDNHPIHPSIPTDTLVVWPARVLSYTYDDDGAVISSTFIDPDTTRYRDDHVYYSNIVRYELGRYITPYGIGLDLGPNGKRWIFDVTDYAPLLHDHVYLEAGNNQELLDLKFVMIKGKPARPVRKIENLWSGSFSYASLWNDTEGRALNKYLDPEAASYRVKMRISGHGFGGPSNCAEFCPKFHFLRLDGQQRFAWSVWDECATNFVYPQGGTWVYDRAGWCPGAMVSTFDHEITPFVTPGDTVSIDYAIENPAPYSPEGNYVFEGQLVTYGTPAYQHEASIEEILTPTLDDRYARRNPVCDHPRIRIRNNGTQPLTKLYITYGVEGGISPCYYIWQGNLAFLKTADIDLPRFNWTGMDPQAPVFYVQIDQPNGQTDENPVNNFLQQEFRPVTRYLAGTILEIRTNNAANENSYTITDADGNIVKFRTFVQNNTIHRDTLSFPKGCYTFHFRDDNVNNAFDGQDGLSWWANSDGAGFINVYSPTGSFIKRFNPDFGADVYEQFTMYYDQGGTYFPELECEPFPDTTTAIDAHLDAAHVAVYPNPNNGRFTVAVDWPTSQASELMLYDAMGQQVYRRSLPGTRQGSWDLDTHLPAGVYILRIDTPQRSYIRKLILQR
ncbi:MAG: hypothetical protein OHK0039_12360 [Bacteroidia bacterium]